MLGAAGAFGTVGNGISNVKTKIIALKKTVTPAHTKAEIRAQFRKRINPIPVKIPRTAKPRKSSRKIPIMDLANGGICGVLVVVGASMNANDAKKSPSSVNTLPPMATIAAARTDVGVSEELLICVDISSFTGGVKELLSNEI